MEKVVLQGAGGIVIAKKRIRDYVSVYTIYLDILFYKPCSMQLRYDATAISIWYPSNISASISFTISFNQLMLLC